jgi:hypothetical protein
VIEGFTRALFAALDALDSASEERRGLLAAVPEVA